MYALIVPMLHGNGGWAGYTEIVVDGSKARLLEIPIEFGQNYEPEFDFDKIIYPSNYDRPWFPGLYLIRKEKEGKRFKVLLKYDPEEYRWIELNKEE